MTGSWPQRSLKEAWACSPQGLPKSSLSRLAAMAASNCAPSACCWQGSTRNHPARRERRRQWWRCPRPSGPAAHELPLVPSWRASMNKVSPRRSRPRRVLSLARNQRQTGIGVLRNNCPGNATMAVPSGGSTSRRRFPSSLASIRRYGLRRPASYRRGLGARRYSHSMVPGGLLVMSYTTRLIPSTSLTTRLEMRSSTPSGRRDQSAVMPS